MKDLLIIPAIILVCIGILIVKPLAPDTFEAHSIGFISTMFQVFGGILFGYTFTK